MKVFIGYDSRENEAWNVAKSSMQKRSSIPLDIQPIDMRMLQKTGIYRRLTVYRNKRLWDIPSQAPISTSHAIARFFIPILVESGWVLFTDGDILVRKDIAQLIDCRDSQYAMMVVKHAYSPTDGVKKRGEIQQPYPRKNWSSVMLWNLDHTANRALTLTELNTWPGRDLHAFKWLKDEDIGELPEEWNWLSGHSASDIEPAIVHFTEGLPDTIEHEHDSYADDWRAAQMELEAV